MPDRTLSVLVAALCLVAGLLTWPIVSDTEAPASRPSRLEKAVRSLGMGPVEKPVRSYALAHGAVAYVDAVGAVTVLNRNGVVLSWSSCGDHYNRAVRFFTNLQHAVARGNRASVASMGTYPVQWGRSSTPAVGAELMDQADLLDRYDDIFIPAYVASIESAEPGALFCRNGGFMLGHGQVWAYPTAEGAIGFQALYDDPALDGHT